MEFDGFGVHPPNPSPHCGQLPFPQLFYIFSYFADTSTTYLHTFVSKYHLNTKNAIFVAKCLEDLILKGKKLKKQKKEEMRIT